jgi:hypothetical protein
MIQTDKSQADYRRDLDDGLVVRWSTAADTGDFMYLASMVFRDGPDAPPNDNLAALLHESMSGRFLPTGAGDVAVVEDTRRREHRLVCCTTLWRLTWDYEGIPFAVGRPEIVATEPEYRKRGLVRAVFELIHARSEAEGHLAQGITGIPYFYRQFGYEYALDLDVRRLAYFALIPKAPEGTPEPFSLRDATAADIPLIQSLYDQSRAIYPVSTRIPEQWWRYQIGLQHRIKYDDFWNIQIIVDEHRTPLGYVIIPELRWRQSMNVHDLVTAPGVNLQAVMPSLLRTLRTQAERLAAAHNAGPVDKIAFRMGVKHPAYAVLSKELVIEPDPPYAWYVRVPDLPRFLRHIAPALERRLATSPLAGYNGALKLNFYRDGLQMVFDKGQLTSVAPWQAPLWSEQGDALFPPLVFLQLLFGRRSLEELQYAYPDVRLENAVELLVNTLFPANPSWVLPMG